MANNSNIDRNAVNFTPLQDAAKQTKVNGKSWMKTAKGKKSAPKKATSGKTSSNMRGSYKGSI